MAGHWVGNPGSILNAYRDGDIAFDDAVRELNERACPECKRLKEAMERFSEELRQVSVRLSNVRISPADLKRMLREDSRLAIADELNVRATVRGKVGFDVRCGDGSPMSVYMDPLQAGLLADMLALAAARAKL